MFARFVAVGAAAFVVNQAALFLFYDSPVSLFLPGKDAELNLWFFTHPDSRLLVASLLAVELSIAFKFASNEWWTFWHRQRRGWMLTRFVQFNASCIASSLVTVATVNVMTPLLDISPYVSNAIGVLGGFAFNWMTSVMIWPGHPEGEWSSPGASVD